MHFKRPQLTPEAIVANAKKKFIVYLMVWESKVVISVIECICAGHLVWSTRTKCKSLCISMRIYYPLTIQSQDDYLQRTPGNDMFRTPFGCRTVVRNFSSMRARSSTSSVVICVICAPNGRIVFIDGSGVGRGATERYQATRPRWWGGVALQSTVATDNLWLQRCRWTWWTGPRCRIGTPPQACNGPGGSCSPPSSCRDWGMPPHALDRVRISERRRTWGTKLLWNSLLKPQTVPDWLGSRARGSRCDPLTPSSVTVLTISLTA